MEQAIAVRTDFTAGEVRQFAKRCAGCGADDDRPCLAIAALDVSREDRTKTFTGVPPAGEDTVAFWSGWWKDPAVHGLRSLAAVRSDDWSLVAFTTRSTAPRDGRSHLSARAKAYDH